MSIGAVGSDTSSLKVKEPTPVFISDGTLKYPIGHPFYFSELLPDGDLMLNCANLEFAEFRVNTDRNFNIKLYKHKEGARFRLFVYRSTADSIVVSFDDIADVLTVTGREGGDVSVINAEIINIGGLLKPLIVDFDAASQVPDARSTDAILVSQDIPFNGVSIGSYANGDSMNKGDTLTQILTRFAQTSVPPTYASPTFGIVPNSQSLEAGSLVNFTIVPTFNQNDAGALNRYLLELNNNSDGYAPLLDVAVLQNYIQAEIQIGDGSFLQYRATVYYDEGETKNDNLGNPYPDTKILAGSKQDSLVYTGQRNAFYAADTGTENPATSAQVRAMAGKRLNPGAGTSFTINIPAGTSRVMFAYPATIRDVSTVKYVELGNAEVADTFTKLTLNVEGANEFTAIPYKVYVYLPDVAFGSSATYNITL